MQTTPAQDTLLLAEETVPLDVAHGQLDAALSAQLEVPAFVPPPPVPVTEPGVSLVVPLMLAVALVLLFGLRALALGGRGWVARFVQPALGSGPKSQGAASPTRSAPIRKMAADPVPKSPPPPPPRKTVELPPHVAAMLSRMEERRSAGTAPAEASPPADAQPQAAPPPQTLGDSGLDVVIGS